MTLASTLLFLGFTLLVALGIFALGLVLAASVFALLAAGADTARFAVRVARFLRRWWHGMGANGRAFVVCWAGIALCAALASGDLLLPRLPRSAESPLDGFDLLGIALCLPAAAQIADRWAKRQHSR